MPTPVLTVQGLADFFISRYRETLRRCIVLCLSVSGLGASKPREEYAMRQSKIALAALLVLIVASVTARAATDTPKEGATLQTKDVATEDMKLIPSGAMAKVGFYMPQRLELSADKPVGVKKAPEMTSPVYGTLMFGGKSYLLAIDEPAGKDAKLYLDSNGNGDLTDDPAATWTKRSYRGPGGKQFAQYMGQFMLPLKPGDESTKVSIASYRFDPTDPQRAQLKGFLFYYPDYAYDGTVKLSGSSYHAMLLNIACNGDFSGKHGAGQSRPTVIMIDINGDGRFDPRRESFDVSTPFNVKGTTWQLADVSADGLFKIEKSQKEVAEIPFPPDLSKGHTALTFKAQKMDGSEVNFPADYKGKLVILDFWATWCGPCMMEVPGLVKAYNEFHPKGVEVLGISLDQPNAADKVKSVTADKGMTWAQVYDGKFWQARIAQLYGIESIPHAFLVDGDNGQIIAEGTPLRGENLATTLQAAVEKKAKSQLSKQ
jgi:thiol-disulfide isomerase/thioredoxin